MKIAVCEAGPIDAFADAGSRSVLDLIEATRALGHDVLVVDESKVGAMDALATWAPDAVVVSRPGLFARAFAALSALDVPLVYFGHDIHEIRMAEAGRLDETHGVQGKMPAVGGEEVPTPTDAPSPNAQRARAMRLIEDFCFTHADLTVLPTEDEVLEVRARHPEASVERLTWFALETIPHAAESDTARRAVFIGSERHEPNRDGVAWLLGDIWPNVSHLFDELVIIGDWSEAIIAEVSPPPAEGSATASNVRFAGRLSARDVDDIMSTSLVGLSPLRFGAGQKRKTLDYLAHGLPTVSTSFGVQGHEQVDGAYPGVVLANTTPAWVAALTELASDEAAAMWSRLSHDGVAFVERHFGPSPHRLAVQAIFSRWDAHE
jgi:glycosyltransferase involved in cell wall biosynthesis